jgi:hypothetical protein
LCLVTTIEGILFNQCAHALGITDGSLLTPDLGGTLLVSDLRIYDLAGLTSLQIADDDYDGDTVRLRAYVFNVARPTFFHIAGWWVFGTGLLPPVLLARGYVPLAVHGGDSGDWVRSTEVTSP